jgi:hypothetical protein
MQKSLKKSLEHMRFSQMLIRELHMIKEEKTQLMALVVEVKAQICLISLVQCLVEEEVEADLAVVEVNRRHAI